MASTIAFTDSLGGVTLSNGKPFPANRFSNWNPITRPYGDTKHRQSDMAPTHFNLGTMYGASFELRLIPERTVGGQRLVTLADRLIAHLLAGGNCTVTTGDADANIYASCYLLPGTEPSLVLADPNQLEHTLTLALFNATTRMVCNYDA